MKAGEFEIELNRIKSKNLYRTLRPPEGIDFCSNDYLGLSEHPNVKSALQKGIEIYGAGSGASRLIRGHRTIFEEFENEIARWAGAKSALFVANGFTANLGLIDTLSDSRTYVFTDRLNHASILDGIRISGANKKYYNHLDTHHLRTQLEKIPKDTQKIIVSETVFSMDGDIPDLQKLVELKKEFSALLVLDEAHAVGIFGKEGMGIAGDPKRLSPSLLEDIDFRVLTLGKSFGLEGGMILGASPFAKDYLINRQRNFIFSTSPMPALAFAGMEALSLLRTMDQERETILKRSNQLRNLICELGMDSLQSESQIIPVLVESPEASVKIAQKFQENGLDVRAIRPPTVSVSRLRISLNAKQSEGDLQQLESVLRTIP